MSKTTGIYFEPGVLADLDKIAKKEDRSRNKVINIACRREIEKHKKEKKDKRK
jgi:metal-responsive CopG/Arc/MetJ family transcriptional regulator